MRKKRKKKFKDLMKDLVFNNPRADRQSGAEEDGYSTYFKNNKMLYDQIREKPVIN